MASNKTKHYRKKKHSSRKTKHRKARRSYKAKKGGYAGNPLALVQYQNPLTYSGTTGWYGQYPRSSDQILFQNQSPRMSYLNNLSLANESIPGVNVADTKPLSRQSQLRGGSKIPLYRQNANVSYLGESQLGTFYPGPTHY